MGLFDSFQDKGTGDWQWGNIIGNLLPSAVSTIGALWSTGDQEKMAEMAAADKERLLDKELANRLAIAQLQAGSAGAGSGAALAAARITDARERQRMKMEAQQALLSGTLKAIEARKPEILAELMTAREQLAQRGGEGVANSYQGLMQAIGNNAPRGQRVSIGRG